MSNITPTWDELLIAELRTNLTDATQMIAALTAQLAMRDARVSELEKQNAAMLDELTHKRQDWALAETEKASLKRHVTALEKRIKRSEEYNRYLTRPRTSEPLPFGEFLGNSGHAPADLAQVVTND